MGGLIQERMVFQEKQIRPCLRACSMALEGNATLASARLRLIITLRTSSGQPSAREASGTTSGSPPGAGLSLCGAGAAAAGAGAAGAGSREKVAGCFDMAIGPG